MQTQLITHNNVSLWARRDGDPGSPCVLLVAGANASHLMWPDEFVLRVVAEGFSVIRYDHRDTGRSTRFDLARRPYSIGDLADDIVVVLDGFGVKRAHVVGLSMGGSLVQAAVIDHPARFLTATVMLTAALDVDFVGNIGRAYTGEPNPMGLPSPRRAALDVLAQRAEPVSTESEELDRRVREWIALSGEQAVLDPEEFRRWESRAIEHAGTWTQPVNHGLVEPIPLARGRELSTVRVPFLVIQGGQDPLNPPPHGRHLADLIPGAGFEEIPALGHSLPSSLHGVIVRALVRHFREAGG